MSLPEELILKDYGDKKVKLCKNRGNLYLSVMDNGHQWTSIYVDSDLINMIRNTLDEFKSKYY